MYITTQTDNASELKQLEEKAAELEEELYQIREQADALRNGSEDSSPHVYVGPQIYLQPLRPYDLLRTKWNLGTGLEIPRLSDEAEQLTAAPEVSSNYLRLFGLIASGDSWECRLPFAYIAEKGSLILGRDPDTADIVLPDEEISRNHIRITLTEKGLEVIDLNSTNGSAINGMELPLYGEGTPLRNGDTLILGDVMLQAEITRSLT